MIIELNFSILQCDVYSHCCRKKKTKLCVLLAPICRFKRDDDDKYVEWTKDAVNQKLKMEE